MHAAPATATTTRSAATAEAAMTTIRVGLTEPRCGSTMSKGSANGRSTGMSGSAGEGELGAPVPPPPAPGAVVGTHKKWICPVIMGC